MSLNIYAFNGNRQGFYAFLEPRLIYKLYLLMSRYYFKIFFVFPFFVFSCFGGGMGQLPFPTPALDDDNPMKSFANFPSMMYKSNL
jgi:hypothetical protein